RRRRAGAGGPEHCRERDAGHQGWGEPGHAFSLLHRRPPLRVATAACWRAPREEARAAAGAPAPRHRGPRPRRIGGAPGLALLTEPVIPGVSHRLTPGIDKTLLAWR